LGGIFGSLFGGGPSFSGIAAATMPDIIPFAKDGIVTKPTIAMIGETGEKEAVIPLSRLNDMTPRRGNGEPLEITITMHNHASGTPNNDQLDMMQTNLAKVVDRSVQAAMIKQKRPGGLMYG